MYRAKSPKVEEPEESIIRSSQFSFFERINPTVWGKLFEWYLIKINEGQTAFNSRLADLRGSFDIQEKQRGVLLNATAKILDLTIKENSIALETLKTQKDLNGQVKEIKKLFVQGIELLEHNERVRNEISKDIHTALKDLFKIDTIGAEELIKQTILLAELLKSMKQIEKKISDVSSELIAKNGFFASKIEELVEIAKETEAREETEKRAEQRATKLRTASLEAQIQLLKEKREELKQSNEELKERIKARKRI